jgi:hypothetical protein
MLGMAAAAITFVALIGRVIVPVFLPIHVGGALIWTAGAWLFGGWAIGIIVAIATVIFAQWYQSRVLSK